MPVFGAHNLCCASHLCIKAKLVRPHTKKMYSVTRMFLHSEIRTSSVLVNSQKSISIDGAKKFKIVTDEQLFGWKKNINIGDDYKKSNDDFWHRHKC